MPTQAQINRAKMKNGLAAAKDQIVLLEAELKQKTSRLSCSESAHSQACAEIEQLHTILDALPGSIDRKAPDGYSLRSAATRLAAWFATSSR